MARNGPPGDFHNEPTRHANYGMSGQAPVEEPQPAAPSDPAEEDEFFGSLDPEAAEPTPWYRRPVLLAGWLVLVLILIGLIVFGIVELNHGEEGTSPGPTSSTTTPTTATTATTTVSTTPTTTAPTNSTSEQAPQQTGQQPTQQQPSHRHHLPQLPSVITIPGVPTVITVPPGLR